MAAIVLVYFVQGILGLSRLAKDFFVKDELGLDPQQAVRPSLLRRAVFPVGRLPGVGVRLADPRVDAPVALQVRFGHERVRVLRVLLEHRRDDAAVAHVHVVGLCGLRLARGLHVRPVGEQPQPAAPLIPLSRAVDDRWRCTPSRAGSGTPPCTRAACP